ncbi:MAG: CopD family protein, partial [Halobacteria archaeon]|nr:CopD family protein [Halobacteria archaeon]
FAFVFASKLVLGGAATGIFGLAVFGYRTDASVEDEYRSPRDVTVLLFSAVMVVGVGMLDVRLIDGSVGDVAVRILHLSAFVVWLGGAVWNIFVAVPIGKQNPTARMVRVAGQQLERFRWAVRTIIPVLLLTGVFQAYRILGADVANYVTTPIGIAVLVKVGFILVLVGIFLTCPMWSACSPIDGVCDLGNLNDNDSDDEGKND